MAGKVKQKKPAACQKQIERTERQIPENKEKKMETCMAWLAVTS
jgi:hypothetical protein